MLLVIYSPEQQSPTEFVAFWGSQYKYPQESLYNQNIGKPLTARRLHDLFLWKNGMRLSDRKHQSVERNYIKRLDELKTLPRSTDLAVFLEQFGQHGAIWGIFLLHCWQPEVYPIFDQHVHRAMRFIAGRERQEIGGWSDKRKIEAYTNNYLPFYRSFEVQDSRRLDRALWVFGKFLSGSRFPDIIARGYGQPIKQPPNASS